VESNPSLANKMLSLVPLREQIYKKVHSVAMADLIGGPELTGKPERRRRRRTGVRWQVHFLPTKEASGFVTTTENLSSGGFSCCSPVLLRPGNLTLCLLEVPTHQSGSALFLKCKTRVIWVQAIDQDGHYGIGCQIEDYWFEQKPDEAGPGASL
jgi:PilZ domain